MRFHHNVNLINDTCCAVCTKDGSMADGFSQYIASIVAELALLVRMSILIRFE